MSEDIKFTKTAIDWRRNIVLSKLAAGWSQSDIAKELKLHPSTISLDVQYLNEKSKRDLRSFIEDRLPMEVSQAFMSYDNIIRVAWDTANNTKDEKTKIQALHLIKETRESRIDLVSNVDIGTKIMDMARQKPKSEEEQQQVSEHYGGVDEEPEDLQEPIEEE